MKLFKLNAVALAIGVSALSNMAVAEITTPRAVVGNDGAESLIATANFSSAVEGDLYVAIVVGDTLLFLVDNGNKVTESVNPFAESQQYVGTIPLLDFSTEGVPAGRYPMYQVVTQAGTNPLDTTNWVTDLSSINFMVGLPVEVSGDFDQDGFADNDVNQDGFYDDDLNRDGFRDGDFNKDGFDDADLNQNGEVDDIEFEQYRANSPDMGSDGNDSPDMSSDGNDSPDMNPEGSSF